MQTRNGRFELGPRLRTGRSEVYSGRACGLGYPVVVKIPTGEDAKGALARECAALRSARHLHIARLLDVTSVFDGQDCMVLDWLDGVTLERFMYMQRRVDPARSAWIARQILAAMEFLHGAGIVIGDLQPSNIMVTPGATAELVTVFDLGAAYGTGAPDPERPLASPTYAAPEVRRGKRPTERSDVYALGAILYELVGGVRLSSSEGRVAPLDTIVPVSVGLARLVERCTATEPKARFSDARDLIEALESLDPSSLVKEGVPPGEQTLVPAPELRTLELPDDSDQERITLPRAEAPADAEELASLRSTGDPSVWVLTGEPTLDAVASRASDGEFGLGVRVVCLDEVQRGEQLGLLNRETVPPPWVVLFGSSHTTDALLAWIGSRSAETARVLVVDGNRATSEPLGDGDAERTPEDVINGPGVDRIVDTEEFVEATLALLHLVGDRRRVHDQARLLLKDSLADTAAIQARLGAYDGESEARDDGP